MDNKKTSELIKKIESKALDYFGNEFKADTFMDGDLSGEIDFIGDLDLTFYLSDLQGDCFRTLELRTHINTEDTEINKSFGIIVDYNLDFHPSNWESFLQFILDCETRTIAIKKELLIKLN